MVVFVVFVAVIAGVAVMAVVVVVVTAAGPHGGHLRVAAAAPGGPATRAGPLGGGEQVAALEELDPGHDDVPGLGPTRKNRLLKEFGSVKRLRALDEQALLDLPWLPEAVGRAVFAQLHPLDVSR